MGRDDDEVNLIVFAGLRWNRSTSTTTQSTSWQTRRRRTPPFLNQKRRNQRQRLQRLLKRSYRPSFNSSTVKADIAAALKKLFEAKAPEKLTEEIDAGYPEPPEIAFLSPDPLAEVEGHLKASRLFLAMKADTFLVKLGENLALLARPLADALSYLAEVDGPVDNKIMAERLSDTAEALVATAHLNRTTRRDGGNYFFSVIEITNY